ncbi:piggyBac transposable element-derived protein 4-like [Melanaphis sacchari]|uniref:piggyBac transposable element-derived protein 4-like n=1 Tax=Melanaphis sacchari TaxID=742174 RepID=UPI000DC12D14|nr:piggyBac transposable element-derived protein 4-like [Melanaphis sacchari]
MDEFERRRIEHLLDTFSDEEVWGGVSDDEDAEESTTENMSENITDTEQSDLESNSSDSIIDYSNSDLSYHESDDELPLNLRKKYFVGKDGTKWSRRPPNQRIRVASVNHVTEKHGVTEIAKNTKTILEAWNLFFPLEMIEHIVEWALKNGHRKTRDIWSNDGCGIDIVMCAMSENRFLFLLRSIRFDDYRSREERKKIDKMTHIRKVFDDFVQNCKMNYKISEYATLDEKLQSFRGRCPFRQYMPNKPAKYGIKIFALVDSISYYTSNLEVYTGVQPDGPFRVDNSAISVTKRLVLPILKTVSYKANKKKTVLLLSTMHSGKIIDETTAEKKKPEIITAYNCTKGGVDTMDFMSENYSVARASARWPLTIFYALMNNGGINAQIIYQENTKNKITRLQFLKALGKELMQENVKIRATIPAVRLQVKSMIKKYFDVQETIQNVRSKGRCSFCERTRDRKTTKVCTTCVKLICRDHIIEVCPDCYAI